MLLIGGVACAGGAPSPSEPPPATPRIVFGDAVAERDIAPTIFGANAQIVGRFTWDDARLRERLAELALGTLRFPGGTNANYWDWRTGWYVDDGQPIPDLPPGTPLRPLTLAHFAEAIRATRARPMWVLNMLTSSPGEQMALLRAAREAGLDVDRIELGNEFYFSGIGPRGPDYARRFPSGGDYGAAARALIDSVRRVFGDAPRVAVLGDALQSSAPLTDPRRLGWNASLVASLAPLRPPVTLHHYLDTRTATDASALLVATERQWEALRTGPLATFAGAGHRVWMTEFNLAEGGIWSGTWAHALSVAVTALRMLEEPSIDEIQVHNIVGGARFGLLFSSVSDFGPGGPATRPHDVTASGAAYGRLPWLVAGGGRCGRLRAIGAPALAGTASEAVRAYRCTTAAGSRFLVLNLGPDTARVDGAALGPIGNPIEILTAAPVTVPITSETQLTRAAESLGPGGLVLPPFALARIGPR